MTRRDARLVDLHDGFHGIFCDYNDKDQAKALPSARWDSELKCWRISNLFRNEAQRLVDNLNGTTQPPPPSTTPPANSTLADAFRTLFRLLPEQLRAPAYRALAKALHPDTGGDETATKALTAAWAAIR